MREGFASIEMGWSGPGIFIGLSAMICLLLNGKRSTASKKNRVTSATNTLNIGTATPEWKPKSGGHQRGPGGHRAGAPLTRCSSFVLMSEMGEVSHDCIGALAPARSR